MARISGIDLPKTKEALSVLLTSTVLEEHFFRNFKTLVSAKTRKSTNGMTMNWLQSELTSLKT
jgi:hypothetical protein